MGSKGLLTGTGIHQYSKHKEINASEAYYEHENHSQSTKCQEVSSKNIRL